MKRLLLLSLVLCLLNCKNLIAQCGTTNRALNKPATSSSASEWHEAGQAVDGSTNGGSFWGPVFVTDQNVVEWVSVNLQASYNICKVEIVWDGSYYAMDYTVDVSTDGTNWTTIKAVTGNTASTNTWTGLSGTGSYVRVRMTKKAGTWDNYYILELRVYDEPTGMPSISITSPTGGSQSNVASAITLSATATNADKVEFFYEVNSTTTPIGTAIFQAPYTTSWTPTQPGVYKIKAVATSNFNSTANAEVSITVNGTFANVWSILGNPSTSASTNFLGTTDNQSLVFKTNNVQRLSILSDGKVKIGNLGRGETDALLSVDGTIYAKKLKVTQLTWADYVFGENYKLMSLKEVESFIKKSKHLPGVPSGKEIKDNGLDIGILQEVLLKKIEELTLYIIMQQKRIETLEMNTKSSDKARE